MTASYLSRLDEEERPEKSEKADEEMVVRLAAIFFFSFDPARAVILRQSHLAPLDIHNAPTWAPTSHLVLLPSPLLINLL